MRRSGEKVMGMADADFDAVVIGSGAGGMTAALCLAQAGWRVLVLEQHYLPGGWCHSFSLEGYRFSPGIHYIGRLGPGEALRTIYRGLGVSQDLAFCELNPDGYDHAIIGQQRFDFPKGRDRLAERLKARFSAERAGIDSYLTTIDRLHHELNNAFRFRGLGDVLRLPLNARTLARWALRTGQDLIDHHVSDPLLKAILATQSGDHGLPPSQVSAPVHGAIVHHYLNGGYYPLGGGYAIPKAFIRALKRAGGEIRVKTRVAQIMLEGRRAIGVRLADGQEIRARHVVSNADPEVTFGQLIGRQHLGRRLRRKLDRASYSVTCLSLFMAADMDLRAAGLDSGNFWLYRTPDLDEIYRGMTSGQRVLAGQPDDGPPALFLTATTLKDPSKMRDGHHTLEAFTFTNYDTFTRWARSEVESRPDDYTALKSRLADWMLAGLEELVPGLRRRLVFCELGTPLTNAFYLNATRGNLYGLDKSRFQVGPLAFPYRTEFDGLWLSGASTMGGHGVMGATASGLGAARQILDCRLADLLRSDGPDIQVYPSEKPDQWPERLQKRMARGRSMRDRSFSEPIFADALAEVSKGGS
jgi:phytoene dehydrogenase-like protein